MRCRQTVLLLAMCAASSAWAADRLNVLFLMADDMRPDLGCYGNDMVHSPHIDALASAGVRFERAYCQYPLCNPSRSSMLTGRYPTTTDVLDNQAWVGGLHPEFVTLPRHFKDQGYATLRTGKIFHGGIDDADAWTEGGEKRSFTGNVAVRKPAPNRAQQSDRRVVLDGDGESHNDFKTAERAIAYLKEHQDQPFFLACGFTKPHSPPTAPKRFYDLYDAARIPLPPDFRAEPKAPDGFPAASITRNGDLFIDRAASEAEARQMIQAYWAAISWTDWNVGRVLAELDRLKLRDKTVIVFWGDHGYHLGEKGKWAKHGSLYEIGTRVPLIVAAPGAAGNGHSSSRTVQSIDIYPTLCQLCGIPAPAGLEGHSLKPLLADPRAAWEHAAYTVFGNSKKLGGVAVRTERYRYAEYDGGQGGAMLFDEQADPHEMKNLADDPQLAQIRRELSQRIKDHMQARRDGQQAGR